MSKDLAHRRWPAELTYLFFCFLVPQVSFQSSSFTDNAAVTSGRGEVALGVISASGGVTITFVEPRPSGDGGAGYIWASDATMTNCSFSNNTANAATAAATASSITATATATAAGASGFGAEGAVATTSGARIGKGGAVCLEASQGVFSRCKLRGNAAGGRGGAIWVAGGNERGVGLMMEGCEVGGNVASEGGGIASEGVDHGRGGEGAGAAPLPTTAAAAAAGQGIGGAGRGLLATAATPVAATAAATPATASGTVTSPGAVGGSSSGRFTPVVLDAKGMITSSSSSSSTKTSSLESSLEPQPQDAPATSAADGGDGGGLPGLQLSPASNSQPICRTFHVTNCTFALNEAIGNGAGSVSAAGAGAVAASQSNVDVAHGSGGAVACFDCPCMDLSAVAARSNEARGFGGAVACSQCGVVNIGQSKFDQNTAAAGGAVNLLQPGPGSNISSCSFTGNSAGAATALTIPPELENSFAIAANSRSNSSSGGGSSSRGSGSGGRGDGQRYVKGKVVPVLAALPGCGAAGAGGGLCIQQREGAEFTMGPGNSFEENTAAFGGELVCWQV